MAPRHPPRALCSLTSVNNQPKGQAVRSNRDQHPLSLSRQKLKIFLITSSLVKVRRLSGTRAVARSQRYCLSGIPLVSAPELDVRIHSSGDCRPRHTKTARGSSSRLKRQRWFPARPFGVYPIFSSLLCARRSLLVAPVWSCWFICLLHRSGGDEETRTPDPLLAKEMLFQLSYVPLPYRQSSVDGGRFWTRTRDLCLIRAVL